MHAAGDRGGRQDAGRERLVRALQAGPRMVPRLQRHRRREAPPASPHAGRPGAMRSPVRLCGCSRKSEADHRAGTPPCPPVGTASNDSAQPPNCRN